MSGRSADVELRRNDVLIVPSIHELEERGSFTIGGEVARPGGVPLCRAYDDRGPRGSGRRSSGRGLYGEGGRLAAHEGPEEPGADERRLGRIYTFSLKDGLVTDGDADFEPGALRHRGGPPQPGLPGAASRYAGWRGGVLGRLYAGEEERAPVGPRAPRRGPHAGRLRARGASDPPSERRGARSARDDAAHGPPEQPGRRFPGAGQRRNWTTTTRWASNLDKALSNPGSDYDMVLREGDRLVIPEYVSTVSISGEVMYPNTVLYMAGKHLKYYIGQAGGYGLRAKRSKAYVIYMNGTVSRVKSLRKGAHRAGVRDRHPLEARAQGHEPPGDHEPGHVGGVDRNDGGVDREPVEISGKDDGRDEQSDRPCGDGEIDLVEPGAQAVGRTPEDRQMVRRGGVGGTRHRLQHPQGVHGYGEAGPGGAGREAVAGRTGLPGLDGRDQRGGA